ncbi:hypothetical protein V8G54_014784 [Vigna mungo]|uniref:Uncharacterized protein n=1 Tax=Vigna mungo TaxID=3915 RepID=A0AAQ3RW95_VIGMU
MSIHSFIHSRTCFSGLYLPLSYSFIPLSPCLSIYFHSTTNSGLRCCKRISRMKQMNRKEEIQWKGMPAQTTLDCKSLVGLTSKNTFKLWGELFWCQLIVEHHMVLLLKQ